MAVVWTLKCNGVTKTAAEWRLSGMKRELKSQQQDLFSFVADGEKFDADPVFAFNAIVEVFRDAVRVFYGRVVKIPRSGSGQREDMAYILAGPWWYLDNLIFQKNWKIWDAGEEELVEKLSSRVLVGWDDDENRLTVTQEIGGVLDYAIAKGAPFAKGTIDPGLDKIPSEEIEDLTCAEVIRRLLRWAPNSIAWFDYAAATPTLHIKKHQSLTEKTLVIGTDKISDLQLTPRYDLQVPEVALKFEKINNIDGQDYTEHEIQSYPNAEPTYPFGGLVLTINLQGTSISSIKQKVKVQGVYVSSLDWWKAKLPWLKDSRISSLSIVSGSSSKSSSYNDEIIEGGIADWMNKNEETCECKARIEFYFQYGATLNDVEKRAQEITCRVRATDASTTTYSLLTDYTAGEAAPAALAQAIYENLNKLQYDGSLTLAENETMGVDFLGCLLNLSAGRSEWETMKALIQSVSEDLDNGITNIVFGPAPHLSPGDLVELNRMNRRRRTFDKARTSGGAGGGSGREVGDKMPIENSHHIDPQPTKSEITIPQGEYTHLLKIDPYTADTLQTYFPSGGANIKWREVNACDDDGPGKMLILCSEVYHEP